VKRNPIPDNFIDKGVPFPRWLVLEQFSGKPSGRVYAMLSSKLLSESQARKVGEEIATRLGRAVVVVMEHRGPGRNPTLVHHGLTGPASYHVLWDRTGHAIADLYTPASALAKRITQAISNVMDAPMRLLDNVAEPKQIADHPVMFRAGVKRNPADPQVGEVWDRIGGGRSKIVGLTPGGKRVQVRHTESGDREWIDIMEFTVTYRSPRPARANPRPGQLAQRGWMIANVLDKTIEASTRAAAGRGPFGPVFLKARDQLAAYLDGRTKRWPSKAYTIVRQALPTKNPGLYDALGNGIAVGSVLVGTGLQNAGRSYTVAQIKGKRVRLQEHLTSRDFWTFPTHYRVDTAQNQRRTPNPKGPAAGSYWQRHAYPQHLARVASMSRASGNAPPMVNLDVVAGNGVVIGSSRLPLNEFLANYAPLEATSPYRRTLPNPREGTNRDFAIATIRAALKKRSGKAWSVTGGSGTSWGWIKVNSPPARRTWRFRLKPGMPDYPENYEEYDSGSPGGHLSPTERQELAALLGIERVHFQGESIPAGHDYYDEYMDRAQGRVPERVGVPYWDNPEREPTRVRERGTMVTAPSSPAERIAALRQIVEEKQYAKIDGKMIDLFSASAILSVYDALNDANKAKYAAMPAPKMGLVAFKLLKPNPRAPLAPGESVTVPYTGRSKRLTSERATVLGITPEGVHVQVRRGRKTVETHTFPEQAVRRRPIPRAQQAGARAAALKGRIELKSLRKRRAEAVTAGEKARSDYECAEAQAKAIQPQGGDPPSPDYRRLLARMRRSHAEADAQGSIAAELERADPATPDPFSVANPRERARAEKTFRRWHEFGSSRVTRMKGPDRVIPKTLVKLGDLVKVVYRSPKYTGRQTLYEHTTKRPRPVLATDPDGRHVHIVGGAMKVTPDGLVN